MARRKIDITVDCYELRVEANDNRGFRIEATVDESDLHKEIDVDDFVSNRQEDVFQAIDQTAFCKWAGIKLNE